VKSTTFYEWDVYTHERSIFIENENENENNGGAKYFPNHSKRVHF
jgi:hypothetical protein